MMVILWFVPEKSKAPEPTRAKEFNAFEYGYPVPPLPGQVLPPSARSLARMQAQAAANAGGVAQPMAVQATPVAQATGGADNPPGITLPGNATKEASDD